MVGEFELLRIPRLRDESMQLIARTCLFNEKGGNITPRYIFAVSWIVRLAGMLAKCLAIRL
jgi:hypothetical protein